MYGIFDKEKKKEYEAWIKNKDEDDSGSIKLDEDFTAKFIGRI